MKPRTSSTVYPTTMGIGYWPTRPRVITEALHKLASSADSRGLTLAEYERRKAEILGRAR